MLFVTLALLISQDADFNTTPLNGAGYLCIAEQATGFHYTRQLGWHQVNFNVDNSRYILRRPFEAGPEAVGGDWAWYQFPAREGDRSLATCSDEGLQADWLKCGPPARSFTFNSVTQRYVKTATAAYITETLAERNAVAPGVSDTTRERWQGVFERQSQWEEPFDSMVLELGECTPL